MNNDIVRRFTILLSVVANQQQNPQAGSGIRGEEAPCQAYVFPFLLHLFAYLDPNNCYNGAISKSEVEEICRPRNYPNNMGLHHQCIRGVVPDPLSVHEAHGIYGGRPDLA
jgi:hypothetical protein